MDICFATNNAHKIEEVRAILGDKFHILSLADIGCNEELPEERDTLEGNSLQKAEFVFRKYGIPCFADDTGLEVDVLRGAPGVYSARYAGEQRSSEDNMALLLKNLTQTEIAKAHFRTVITLIQSEGTHQFEGIVSGIIVKERRGAGGFGYDPIFLPDGFTRTLAELSLEEKNKISHRARALEKLVDFLNRVEIH